VDHPVSLFGRVAECPTTISDGCSRRTAAVRRRQHNRVSMDEPDERDTDRLRDLIESGSQVFGQAGGVGVALLGGSLAGVVAGTAMGEALSRVATEFYDRVAATRQRARGGKALEVALVRIGSASTAAIHCDKTDSLIPDRMVAPMPMKSWRELSSPRPMHGRSAR
jgi:hypothetical protein